MCTCTRASPRVRLQAGPLRSRTPNTFLSLGGGGLFHGGGVGGQIFHPCDPGNPGDEHNPGNEEKGDVPVRVPGDVTDRREGKDIAERVNGLLAEPERAKRMGDAGRARAIELFAWSAIAGETAALYRGLLGAD